MNKSSSSSESSCSNSSDNVQNRPEIKNQISQKLHLLKPCKLFPNHPRTIFFYHDPNLNENNIPDYYEIEEVEITDKKYMVVYKAYKNLPLCLSEPMNFNHIIRTKLFEDTNIIWKLLKREKMYPILQDLCEYQRFNHFPITWKISRKDNLYTNYKRMQTQFPDDYNYMPESFILPQDRDSLLLKLDNYKFSDDNMWIIKPCASSRGRGIKIMKDIDSLPNKGIITKYISRPSLINGKKFDLRLYLLVTGYSPLKIYLYNDGLVRFASEDYSLDVENITNSYIHLTNYSINKTSENFIKNDNINNEKGSKWSLKTLIAHYEKIGIEFKSTWDKIKDIMIKTLLSICDDGIPFIKQFELAPDNLYEIYGIDILLDEYMQPWLIEVNLNPSLNCDSDLDKRIKSRLITDLLNIVGISPYSHDRDKMAMDGNVEYESDEEEVIEKSICEFYRPSGGFERIFPYYNNFEGYKRYLKCCSYDNICLWKFMKKNNII